MPKILYPKSYMTPKRRFDIYNSDLTFYGNRLLYEYERKSYIIKKDNKAYQVTLATFNGRKFVMLKPDGIIKNYITSTG